MNRDYVIAWNLYSNIPHPGEDFISVNASYRCRSTSEPPTIYYYWIYELKQLSEDLSNIDTRVYTAWHTKLTNEGLNGAYMEPKSGVPTRDSQIALGIGVRTYLILPNYNYTFKDNTYLIELKNQWGSVPYATKMDGGTKLDTTTRLPEMRFVHKAKQMYSIQTGHETAIDVGVSTGTGSFDGDLYLKTSFD